jgi:hypothetical protein
MRTMHSAAVQTCCVRGLLGTSVTRATQSPYSDLVLKTCQPQTRLHSQRAIRQQQNCWLRMALTSQPMRHGWPPSS